MFGGQAGCFVLLKFILHLHHTSHHRLHSTADQGLSTVLDTSVQPPPILFIITCFHSLQLGGLITPARTLSDMDSTGLKTLNCSVPERVGRRRITDVLPLQRDFFHRSRRPSQRCPRSPARSHGQSTLPLFSKSSQQYRFKECQHVQ